MSSIKRGKENLINGGIIVLAVIGITYFGYNAFSGGSDAEKPNPFEYNIEHFKQNDPALNHYTEKQKIAVNLENLTALAIGPEDNIYVAGDNVYLSVDGNGNILRSVNCGQSARCISIDLNNDVFLGMTDHVRVYDQEGVEKARWKSPDKNPLFTSIKVTSEAVYVADAGNFIVWKYDKSGKILSGIGQKDEQKDIPGFVIPSPYFDLAVDPDGFLWVVNPGRLSLENYTTSGELRSSWGTPGMNVEEFCGCCNPSHFAIQNDGSFITGEKGIVRVKVYNRAGKLVSVVAGPDQFDEGTVGIDLAADSKNRIYVLDPMRKMVRVFEKKPDA
jgi:hypothetical protein